MSEQAEARAVQPETPAVDGRRRRSQRSRERILEAVARAISEPGFVPTAEQVAARSGYSISTIFRHFGGRDGLLAAMQQLVRARMQEHLAAGPFEGDTRARAAELVRRLAAVFETVTPFLGAVAQDRQRTVGEAGRRELDALVRGQIDAALAGDLTARAPDAADLPDLLAAVLSLATWRHMRSIQGHDVERARALLGSAVLRVLGEPG